MRGPVCGLVILLAFASGSGCLGERAESAFPSPDYGETFWSHWGDGRAELAGYDLRYTRYGESRRGTAVAIFVTESFSSSDRVKHEDPRRAESDVFPVLKLNLMQDFATGVYDYNLMTSTFVTLRAVGGRPAGLPTKVTFSSQEWCGQVYAQLLFDQDGVRHDSHSYFDGEADQRQKLDYPAEGLAEDALLLWSRGLAAPTLRPGESRRVRLLRSVETARLDHLPVAWLEAEIARDAEPGQIRVPAGDFAVDVLRVSIEPTSTERTYPPTRPRLELPARDWVFYVEQAAPHRLIKWTRSDGVQAELLQSARLPYWTLNGPGFEKSLQDLGLRPRPPRTP